MLFHVVNERHRRRRSMIFTTNKPLKAWGLVLHDEDLAQAIIDRVLERGRLIRLDGPSVRTLHLNLDEAMKEGSDQDAEVARISGNSWPEFPEPTSAGAESLISADYHPWVTPHVSNRPVTVVLWVSPPAREAGSQRRSVQHPTIWPGRRPWKRTGCRSPLSQAAGNSAALGLLLHAANPCVKY